MWVLQSFVSSPLFLSGRVPHEHTVAPHCLHFSGQDSPAGGHCGVLWAPHSLQVAEPHVCAAQWEREAAPCCTYWISLRVEEPCVHALLFLLGLAPVGAGGTGFTPCRWTREPGWGSCSRFRGRASVSKQWCLPIPPVLGCFLRSRRALLVPQPFLCGHCLAVLLAVQRLTSWLSCLSGGFALSIDVEWMYSVRC